MSSRLLAVTFDAQAPAPVARFWASLLGREVVDTSRGALLPADDTQVGLRFAPSRAERVGQNRLHLHVTSSGDCGQDETVARALELGASHLDVGQLPEETHVVLADPGGNEFCVIGPGNSFLAGCGRLGEVSCDGSRDVGLFWRDALGWPLVWDHEGETAVQSAEGGTKVSWGGPPVAPKHGRNRQRFDLAAADVSAEVRRLEALGATRLGERDGTVELADPDGNEFLVLPV